MTPYACFACRRSFMRNPQGPELTCTHCGERAFRLDRKFKAPKQTDVDAWKLAEYLVEHGFRFHTVVEDGEPVSYPTRLEDAPTFVARFRTQARIG